MNVNDSLAWNAFFISGLAGAGRGCAVGVFTCPLEVIKIQQQAHPIHIKAHQIASGIWSQEGLKGFYKGFTPYISRVILKQAWTWPVMMGIPAWLEKQECFKQKPLQQQCIAGLIVTTLDAGLTTHIERSRILSIVNHTSLYPQPSYLPQLLKEGWHGMGSHWMKLAVGWTTFLTTQQYLRSQFKQFKQKETLDSIELATIGVAVALIVSVANTPFDVIKTLKQSQELGNQKKIGKLTFGKLYRGWGLNVSLLIIHNVASVILIDRLAPLFSQSKS